MEKSGFQKNFDFSRSLPPVSRAPASELVLQRGGLASKIAFQGGNLESKVVYRRVVVDFENRKNIFGSILDLDIFGQSHSSSHCRGDRDQACLPTDSAL